MTARIRDFLKRRPNDGPCLVVDLDVVRENYLAFAKSLPDTRVFYAVKANPAPEILKLLADLGSFWGRPLGSNPQTPPVYSFLECYDYAYYETLDVRFYGSMPLLKFWPDLEKRVMREVKAHPRRHPLTSGSLASYMLWRT